MPKTMKQVYSDETYGLYDLHNNHYVWTGTLNDCVNKLKYENLNGFLTDIRYLSFCSRRMYDNQNVTEKDERFLYSYENKKSELVHLYENRRYVFVYGIYSAQKNVNIFDIWNTYKKAVLHVDNSDTLKYYEKENFRKGPIPKKGVAYRRRKHKKSVSYRTPNTKGMRLELSRLKEDRQYIKTLNKQGLLYGYGGVPYTVKNSWKDKKVRHQWQVKAMKNV